MEATTTAALPSDGIPEGLSALAAALLALNAADVARLGAELVAAALTREATRA